MHIWRFTALKKIFIITLILVSCFYQKAIGQESDSGLVIYGQVLDDKTGRPISNAHVVNKRNFVGTVTNTNGYFYIELNYGDSIVVSSLGYDFYYYVTHITPINVVRMRLIERMYFLTEVNVSSYKLTSNKPQEMTVGKPMIPKTSDIRYPNPTKATIANPIDLLYQMFSNKSKQLKVLRALQAQDSYKRKLQEGNNRELLTKMTGLSKDELEEFLFFCKYSEVQISTMNDYALLMTLMGCYDEYLRIQEREAILQQYEENSEPSRKRFK